MVKFRQKEFGKFTKLVEQGFRKKVLKEVEKKAGQDVQKKSGKLKRFGGNLKITGMLGPGQLKHDVAEAVKSNAREAESINRGIKNAAKKSIKKKGKKIKEGAKNFYENTGDVVAGGINKTVGSIAARPGIIAAATGIQAVGKLGIPTAIVKSGHPELLPIYWGIPFTNPITAGAIGSGLPKKYLENLSIEEKKRYIKGFKAARKLTNHIKEYNLKTPVESVMRDIKRGREIRTAHYSTKN